MSKILITGGTSVLGQAVSKLFISNRLDFIIGSRSQKTKNYDGTNSDLPYKWIYMDLTKNDEIDKFTGNNIDTVLHLASLPLQKIQGQPSDIVLTRNLLNSIEKKSIKHFIYTSIVGIDKIPFAYYKAKLECEHLIKISGIPYTILRATQFHDFVDAVANKLLKPPICFVPKAVKMQPIQVEAVAMELLKITKELPLNGICDIDGKKIYNMREIIDSLLKVRQENKPVVNIPIIGQVLHAFANGYNTSDNISTDSNTWEEYLSKKYVK